MRDSIMADIPIACSLTAAQLDQRREILAALRARCAEVQPIENGLRLRFEAASGVLSDIARVIDLERQCCRFLRFRLDVLPDGGPVLLELNGPEGTAEFLGAELGFTMGDQ
ncbi:MAG TPA: hypothetical protein VH394_09315 [Thermoanaerobaculia bacterium]|nr:hypothetical protein [Thermoanaerobaculia bacterium]